MQACSRQPMKMRADVPLGSCDNARDAGFSPFFLIIWGWVAAVDWLSHCIWKRAALPSPSERKERKANRSWLSCLENAFLTEGAVLFRSLNSSWNTLTVFYRHRIFCHFGHMLLQLLHCGSSLDLIQYDVNFILLFLSLLFSGNNASTISWFLTCPCNKLFIKTRNKGTRSYFLF